MEALCRHIVEAVSLVASLVAGYTYTVNDETTMRMLLPEGFPPEFKATFQELKAQLERRKETGPSELYALHVINTKATLSLLLRRPDGSHVTMIVNMPAGIHSLDSNNAATTLGSRRRIWDLPAVQRLLQLCPRVYHLISNDKGGSNVLAHKVLRRDALRCEAHFRKRCDVHMCHTAAGSALDVTQPSQRHHSLCFCHGGYAWSRWHFKETDALFSADQISNCGRPRCAIAGCRRISRVRI